MVKLLFIDNLDSFTFNLVDYFSQEGAQCIVIRNNTDINQITKLQYHGVIISPGPGLPINSGNLMSIINHYYNKLPILGICLGHQAIGHFFGAQLIKASKPMHGKMSKVSHISDPIFEGIPDNFSAIRYHSIIVSHLPNSLIKIANSDDGEIMAIKHSKYPIYGIQYHPEAIQTEYGKEIVRNWIQMIKIAT